MSIVVFFVPVFMFLCALPAAGDSGHDLLSCDACHIGDTGHGGVPLPAPDACLQCHPDRTGPGHHPIDISPPADMDTLSGLSLPGGRVWCSTCHNPHGSEHPALLRISAADICTVCHKK